MRYYIALFVCFAISWVASPVSLAQESTTSTTAANSGHPMHVVILGDSNTWIGGDDCDKPRGWNKWFADVFQPLSCKSYARSGATWTNTIQTRKNPDEDIAVLGNDNVIYNQIVRLLAACDCVISSSRQEGLPINLIEASASGKYIIATDVRGNADVVKQSGFGTLVKLNDDEAMAEAIVDRIKKGNNSAKHSERLYVYEERHIIDSVLREYCK